MSNTTRKFEDRLRLSIDFWSTIHDENIREMFPERDGKGYASVKGGRKTRSNRGFEADCADTPYQKKVFKAIRRRQDRKDAKAELADRISDYNAPAE